MTIDRRITGARFRRTYAALAGALLVSMGVGAIGTDVAVGGRAETATAWEGPPVDPGELPMRFEENAGQTDSRVRFLARGGGYTLFLTPEEAVLSLLRPTGSEETGGLATETVRLGFAGSTGASEVGGIGRLPGATNYLAAGDSARGVAAYGAVAYRDVYPGIDAMFYGRDGAVEYDFVVAPGADPAAIAVTFSGASVTLRDDGALDLGIAGGTLRQAPPVLYQKDGRGDRTPVDGSLRIDGGAVRFTVGDYDRSRPLVIDPVISYSSFVGGTGGELATAVAVDGTGATYVTGITTSADFPVSAGAFDTIGSTNGGCDSCYPIDTEAFVLKLTPAGDAVAYATYLGGSLMDTAADIAVDSSGNAIVGGVTYSPAAGFGTSDFPTTPGALRPSGTPHAKPCATTECLTGYVVADGFVTKLDPTGSSLLYSTLLSGNANSSVVTTVDVAADGRIYAAGSTVATDFPTTPTSFQPYRGGGSTANGNLDLDLGFVLRCEALGCSRDGFLTVLTPAGRGPLDLAYSSFVGGSDVDAVLDMALDPSGAAYLVGVTTSLNFPTTPGSVMSKKPSLEYDADAFVTKVRPDGRGPLDLAYSTYLGTPFIPYLQYGYDLGRAIAVDDAGHAHVAGVTNSRGLPAKNAFQPEPACSQSEYLCDEQGFVAKLRADGGAFEYSTYFPETTPWAAAVDDLGVLTLVGDATERLPIVDPGPGGARPSGEEDAFVATLSSNGALTSSQFLGGSATDAARDVAVDAAGRAHVVGGTSSKNFPRLHGLGGGLQGGPDGFLTKYAPSPAIANGVDLALSVTDTPDPVAAGQALTYRIVVGNRGAKTAEGAVLTHALPSGVALTSASTPAGACSEASGTVSCALGSIAGGQQVVATVVVTTEIVGEVAATATVTSANPDRDLSNNTETEATSVRAPGATGADLSIDIDDSRDPWPFPEPDRYLVYRATVTNHGPETTNLTRFRAVMPHTAIVHSAVPSQGTCQRRFGLQYLTAEVRCDLGVLEPGQTATVDIYLFPTPFTWLLPVADPVAVVAEVSGEQPDPDMTNNRDAEFTLGETDQAWADCTIAQLDQGFVDPTSCPVPQFG